jgi:hypothetical protein
MLALWIPAKEFAMSRSPKLILSTLVLCLIAGVSHARGPTVYQMGPTGIDGTIHKTTIKVTKVAPKSPADGKIKKDDQIIGAGGAKFVKDVRRELAAAVNAAETEEAGGKLTLTLKGNRQVELQLEVLGTYSQTAPYDCAKSEAIIKRAAEHLIKSGQADKGAMHPGLLGLMATGEKKYIDYAGEKIRAAKWAKINPADVDAVIAGDKDMGYVGWYWGYNLITLAEYHLLTGDKSVLPAIRTYATGLARGQDAGGLWGHRMATVKRNGRLPGYAQMNQPSLSCFMGMLLARKCGIDDPVLNRGIARSYKYFESFVGRGAFNYGVHGPNTGNFNNNGTSGSAALCMSFMGNAKGAAFFSRIASTSYNGLERGHASTFFNPLWTPLGTNLAGPEVTQQFFDKSLWLQTMYRSWDGGFSRFGGGSKEGPQAGTALLAYCLPRKVLHITGKGADESIWLKGEAATKAVELSEVNYEAKTADELIALFGDPSPFVRRAAGWVLRSKEADNDFIPRLLTMMKEGSKFERQTAVGYFGWGCSKETALANLEHVGAVLRNTKEHPEVRAAAASVLGLYGEAAYKYYWDMVKFAAEERPDDHFGDIDWAIGGSINRLCSTPFKSGLVKDSALQYKVALKLAANKRQHVRADGLRMLAGMPLEDFHMVVDKVMHVIEDKDSTYHSYHSPGGPVGAGISVLADLNIKEGIDYVLAVLDTDSGKWGFKVRMVMGMLPKYGGNAKAALAKLRADPRLKTIEQGRFGRPWRAMVQAIEEDQNPPKLITLEEARKAGKQ